ncbi:polysaccharide deacetylase family protein [Micromonospora sp. NPDC048930]|uniref:polysaccharide deacetylase family protein n=1 Tax=Micromonospora sp. NPDC048930 TaxID=3364261 RepID=UPI0037247298
MISTGAKPASAAPERSATVTADVSIPVVLYHVVTTNPTGRYQHDLAKFTAEMAYLHDNGYTPLSADEYHSVMTSRTAPPAKPILLTFDDSTADFASNVVPVLQRYGFPSIQFAVSDWVDTAGHLTSAQLATLSNQRVAIENHTKDHQDLSTQTYDQAYASIVACDTFITAVTGRKPTFLAYPYGRTDADAQAAARAAGVTMAFTVASGKTTPADNFLALNRILITSSDTVDTFAKKIG